MKKQSSQSSILIIILFVLLLASWSGLSYLTLRYRDLKSHYNVLLKDLQLAHDQLAKPEK